MPQSKMGKRHEEKGVSGRNKLPKNVKKIDLMSLRNQNLL